MGWFLVEIDAEAVEGGGQEGGGVGGDCLLDRLAGDAPGERDVHAVGERGAGPAEIIGADVAGLVATDLEGAAPEIDRGADGSTDKRAFVGDEDELVGAFALRHQLDGVGGDVDGIGDDHRVGATVGELGDHAEVFGGEAVAGGGVEDVGEGSGPGFDAGLDLFDDGIHVAHADADALADEVGDYVECTGELWSHGEETDEAGGPVDELSGEGESWVLPVGGVMGAHAVG